MSFIYDLVNRITSAIPVLLRRIGSVLIFFAVLGSILGYWIALNGYSFIWLLGLPISMIIMWNDLDEGTLSLIVYLALLYFVPTVI